MDPRSAGRIDAADVVQEAFLEAAAHTEQTTSASRRCRFSCGCGALWATSCWRCTGITSARACATPPAMSHSKAPRRPTPRPRPCRPTHRPRDAAQARRRRGEEKQRLHEALDAMDPIDREVLALRHFEQLTNAEAAGAGDPRSGPRPSAMCGPASG